MKTSIVIKNHKREFTHPDMFTQKLPVLVVSKHGQIALLYHWDESMQNYEADALIIGNIDWTKASNIQQLARLNLENGWTLLDEKVEVTLKNVK